MADALKNPYDETAPLSRDWFRWELADVARRQYEMKLRWIVRLYSVRDFFKDIFTRKRKKICGLCGGNHKTP